MSRLVGAPPGYVGYEEGGQLTEAVRRKPYSVVLFDEIEKAHPDVFNTLLQILDDGRLTDAQGRTVDFRNTVIIMTSNIGSQYLLDGVTARRRDQAGRARPGDGRAARHFRPEFLNRVDEIVLFKPLTPARSSGSSSCSSPTCASGWPTAASARDRPRRRAASSPAEGYDPVYGARPLRRFIAREVETQIARALLRGDIGGGPPSGSPWATTSSPWPFTSRRSAGLTAGGAMRTSIVACPHCGSGTGCPRRPPAVPKCGNCHQWLPWIADAGDDDFAEVAGTASVPVLVDLWATWCGPCRMVSPALERLATERAGQLKLVKVDVDKAPRLSQRFEVQAVPTLLVLRDGEVARPAAGRRSRSRRCAAGWTRHCRPRATEGDRSGDIAASTPCRGDRQVRPRTQGCEECLRLGSPWVHLRLCLTCGHVGCCDSSPMRHARAHAPGRPSDRAVLRARRDLALVLRRRNYV